MGYVERFQRGFRQLVQLRGISEQILAERLAHQLLDGILLTCGTRGVGSVSYAVTDPGVLRRRNAVKMVHALVEIESGVRVVDVLRNAQVHAAD